jgi:hypothetical protein
MSESTTAPATTVPLSNLPPAEQDPNVRYRARELALARSLIGRRFVAVEQALADALDAIDDFVKHYPDGEAAEKATESALLDAGLTVPNYDDRSSNERYGFGGDHFRSVPEELAGWRHPLGVLYEDLRNSFIYVEVEDADEDDDADDDEDQATDEPVTVTETRASA